MTAPSITYRNRWTFIFLTYVYVVVLYLSSNHFDLVRPHRLPLNYIDIKMPFWPWTGWIYITVYIFPLLVGVVVNSDEDIKRVVTSFVAMTTLCTFVFMIYPTVYPRPRMPREAWAGLPLVVVRGLDTARNCFPSQHVALAFLSAFFILRFRPRWGAPAILVAILISISTLTTKQHYVWDVLVGYMLARVTFWLATGKQNNSY